MNNISKGVDQEFDKAKDYCYKLFRYRFRSEKEIRHRLRKRKFSKNIIERIIFYFKGLNYIDDSSFTRSWIEARLKKPYGLRRIEYELRNKGISEKIIKEEIERIKDYSEYKIVKEIVEEKFTQPLHAKQALRIDPNKLKKRLYSFLLRRGFSPEIILEVLDNL